MNRKLAAGMWLRLFYVFCFATVSRPGQVRAGFQSDVPDEAEVVIV